MQEHDIKRKLATIMVADIVGFSRLTANDEDWTIRSLGEFRKIVDEIIDRHDGRIFNTGGDSVLAKSTAQRTASTGLPNSGGGCASAPPPENASIDRSVKIALYYGQTRIKINQQRLRHSSGRG